jgi:hypothetical protein
VTRELAMRLFEKMFRQSACLEVKVSGQVGKSQYVVFKDGAVVIETLKGVRRFNNPKELVSQAPPFRSVNDRPIS